MGIFWVMLDSVFCFRNAFGTMTNSDFFSCGVLGLVSSCFVGSFDPLIPHWCYAPRPSFLVEDTASLFGVWIRFAKISYIGLRSAISLIKNRTEKLLNTKIRFRSLPIFWEYIFVLPLLVGKNSCITFIECVRTFLHCCLLNSIVGSFFNLREFRRYEISD